ncbi:MAG TPA: alkaline phosphatase family protein [Nitrospiria bacterium]|nr:alkaline phosphatase family protein [Nitrospiria bacterium]
MARTLLIALDGATFNVLNPLMEDGVMPFLKSFLENGTRGELLSTPNPLTPPAFTSMMTGRGPGHHGVYDFIRGEEKEKTIFFTLINARDVRCETIWSIASRNNKSITCLNFIAMYPPRPVKGHIVPGFVTSRNLKLNVYPPGLYDQLKVLSGFNVKDVSWDVDQGRKPLLGLAKEDCEEWIQYNIRKERQWFEITSHLMLTDPTDLTAVVFDGVDKLQHLVWRFLDPAYFPPNPSDWEIRVREICRDYFRRLDGFLSELVRIAGPDSRVFMASDHGFGPTHEIFYANAWLNQNGYLTWKEGTPEDQSDSLTAERLREHYETIDWDRTTAYVRTSSSNGIYIRTSTGPGKPGIPLSEYESFRARLVARLNEFRDPATGDRVVKKILTREEAFPGPYMSQAPDLTLVLRDNGFVSILNARSPLKPRPEVNGTHRHEGIFFASGKGIKKGLLAAPRSILDVAPTLLYSIGLPVPEDLEGSVATEIFKPEVFQEMPIRIGSPTLAPDNSRDQEKQATMTAAEQAQVMDRLKTLGYM